VGGTCGTNGREEERVYRLLVGKRERKRPLGRPRGKRVDKIKMGLAEIVLDGVDWTDMVQDK
jgi:hypothetical protein